MKSQTKPRRSKKKNGRQILCSAIKVAVAQGGAPFKLNHFTTKEVGLLFRSFFLLYVLRVSSAEPGHYMRKTLVDMLWHELSISSSYSSNILQSAVRCPANLARTIEGSKPGTHEILGEIRSFSITSFNRLSPKPSVGVFNSSGRKKRLPLFSVNLSKD